MLAVTQSQLTLDSLEVLLYPDELCNPLQLFLQLSNPLVH